MHILRVVKNTIVTHWEMNPFTLLFVSSHLFSSTLFTYLHSSSLFFTPLHSSSLFFSLLLFSSLLFTSLLFSLLLITSLHSSPLLSFDHHHCTVPLLPCLCSVTHINRAPLPCTESHCTTTNLAINHCTVLHWIDYNTTLHDTVTYWFVLTPLHVQVCGYCVSVLRLFRRALHSIRWRLSAVPVDGYNSR